MKKLDSFIGNGANYPLYLGNFADGVVSTTGNITFTNTLDGPAVIKSYQQLIVNAGHTVTVQNACRGLIIYADTLVVYGTITMSAKGSVATPSPSEYSIPLKSFNGEIKDHIRFLPVTVSNGGFMTSASGSSWPVNGNPGVSSSTIGIGGGGGSSATQNLNGWGTSTKFGGNGTYFSGGAGSPFQGGTASCPSPPNHNHSESGLGGGLLIIIARVFSGNGVISSIGTTSAYQSINYSEYFTISGNIYGSSGSGPIFIYSNADNFTGTVSSPVVVTPSNGSKGGNGGAGYIHRQVV